MRRRVTKRRPFLLLAKSVVSGDKPNKTTLLLITMIIQDTLIIRSGFCCATTARMGGTHLVSGHR